jgi:signal transduction histidine kinase
MLTELTSSQVTFDLDQELGQERERRLRLEEELLILKSAMQTMASDIEKANEHLLIQTEKIQCESIERLEIEKALRAKTEELETANLRLKENQMQLIQSEKMAGLGQIAAGVAHEINNPIAYVLSNLGSFRNYLATLQEHIQNTESLLKSCCDENSEMKAIFEAWSKKREFEDIQFILQDSAALIEESVEGTQRVREIVNNLKSFARLDESDVKPADLNEGLENALKIVWNEIKYKAEIIRELSPLPMVRCYPGQLNQVFLNLLVNAAQAIPERGSITLRSGTAVSCVYIEVEDSGCGIPPENIPKLFNPFFTTKPVGKGTGLGLSVSYGIVQKHGGTIEVESHLNQGTRFRVTLPIEGVLHDTSHDTISG